MIFTIHNLHYGQALIADAMHNCAIATTVSRTYAKEIAHEGCVNPNLHKLHGVVNGIDPDIWDPRSDKFLQHSLAKTKSSQEKPLHTSVVFEIKLIQ